MDRPTPQRPNIARLGRCLIVRGVLHVLTGMGECLAKQKKYAEAEPALLRALAVRMKAFGEPHPRTQRRTIKDLGDLYEQWGKPAQSRAYRARLVPAETQAAPASRRCRSEIQE